MPEDIVDYGRVDYPTLILIQLNRIASVRSRLSSRPTRDDVQSYYSSVKVLYMLAPPAVRREVGGLPSPRSVDDLDEFFTRLRDALEKHGLIARRVLEVGRPDVDVLEEGA